MKKILLPFLLLPVIVFCQKVALVHPQLKKPIAYADAIKMKHLESGYFIIENSNIEKVIKSISSYREYIAAGKKIPGNMNTLITGSTYFTARGSKGNYSLVMDTKINKMGSYYVLATTKKSKTQNLLAIDNFISYLKKGS